VRVNLTSRGLLTLQLFFHSDGEEVKDNNQLRQLFKQAFEKKKVRQYTKSC
jgi:hypothetical protein